MGIARLAALSLPRTPPADTLEVTTAVWFDALNTGMAWDEGRDRMRLRSAFGKLATTCEMWPGPKRLIDCLPPVPRQRALPPRLSDPAVAAKAQDEIRALLAVPGALHGARERPMLSGLTEAARGLLRGMEATSED